MKTKRFLSGLLTLVMVIGLLSSITLTASAEETSGNCGANGNNVTWQYNAETKTITFSGSGDMATYDINSNRPVWVNLYSDEIENVIIEDGITSIANVAFYKCTKLKNVSIPDTVTAIYGSAFSDCSSLEEIKIPSSVTIIGGQAFMNCVSLKEIVLPNITELSAWVFNGCTSLTGITIPDTVEFIDGYCFGKTAIKEITIPSSVKRVNNSLFQNVPKLTEVTIPASVTELKSGTFGSSSKLKRVYYLGTKIRYITGAMNNACDFTVYVSKNYNEEKFVDKTPVKTTLHSVTFDMGGYGIKPTDRYAADGEVMEEPFVHSDENAIFEGWYKDAERSVKWNFATDKVTADTVLYAKWKAKEKFTVSFNLNEKGSDAPESQTISENSKVKKPVDPTADDGFVFGGWYKEADCNNAWNFYTDVVTANTTLYAKWIEIPDAAVITLDATYGSCDVKTITASTDGTLSEELPTPTPNDTITEGYWFKGWYDAPEGGNLITADTVFIIDTTIYAQWDIVKPEIIKFNTEKVFFTFPKAGEKITVIFADYEGDSINNIKYVTATTEKTEGENTVAVVLPSGIKLWAGDKIMIWENFGTCMPLCEAYGVTGRETLVEDTTPGIDLPIDPN